jgi:RNA-binding protein YlmH
VTILEKEEALLIKRFKELENRSYNRGVYEYSDFLNIYEQDLLFRNINTSFSLFGGYENAERQIAVFGNEEDFGYSPSYPIVCILVSPLMQKFADDLTHRDFLGSVLGLGIKRETIGDIIIKNNTGYIFCLNTIADFITENLKKVRHTSVKCEKVTETPEEVNPESTEKFIIVASERLDVIIAEIYNLSRSESNNLFLAKKVFVNGKLTENNSHKIKTGDIVSVRGFGRFNWLGTSGETKKGRLKATVEIF